MSSAPAAAAAPPAAPATKLDQLRDALATVRTIPAMRRGGTVTEVTPAYCRVNGLSKYVTLGDTISLESDTIELGEVV
jgi:hypothetical protein